MSELIRVPDLGGEGEVIELLVKVGDRIEADQSVLTLESDKASMEVPSPKAGVIKEIKVKIVAAKEEGVDKAKIQDEITQLQEQLESIAKSSSFNGENWIAGSSLKVIDLKTNEVIAERIGYMYDWAQGSREGFRSPWLMAADNACPAFGRSDVKATTAQIGQTVRFVEKVLHPTK